MNELLEKAKQMYPKGTKFRSVYTEEKHISTGNYELDNDDVFIRNEKDWWCIYYSKRNRWAEIIKEQETIPLKILNNKAEDIFHISKNGDIVLRGKVIANDIELSEILTNLYNKK
jgi:hypothetical protein